MYGKWYNIFMIKRVLWLGAIVGLVWYFLPQIEDKNGSQEIIVSNFALYDSVRNIIGEDKSVRMLIPLGKDAHLFKPNPKDIVALAQSKHFFYVSEGMDNWVENLSALEEIKNRTDLSSTISWKRGHCEHEDHHEHGHLDSDHDLDEENHALDPHYWLDIDNQIATTQAIAEVLYQLYPLEKDLFKEKVQAYIKRMKAIETRYQSKLQVCKQSVLFVTHDAFGYLSARYGFETHPILGLASDAQVDPHTMQELIQALEKSENKIIFFESFVSDQLAQTIAKATGANVDVLQTLATVQLKDEKVPSYESLMYTNLEKISEAMLCP